MLREESDEPSTLAPGDFCWGTVGSAHFVNNAGYLTGYTPRASTIDTVHGSSLRSLGSGTLEAYLGDGTFLELHDVHYVPAASFNFLAGNLIDGFQILNVARKLFKFNNATLGTINPRSFEDLYSVGSIIGDVQIVHLELVALGGQDPTAWPPVEVVEPVP